jgi:hypothetical protein
MTTRKATTRTGKASNSFGRLAGAYVFGDLSSGHIWAGVQDSSGNWSLTLVLNHNLTVSSFGQDPAGELYLLDYGNGAVLRLRAAP